MEEIQNIYLELFFPLSDREKGNIQLFGRNFSLVSIPDQIPAHTSVLFLLEIVNNVGICSSFQVCFEFPLT